MWACRIVHEAFMHLDKNGNCFVTLTYRDPAECTDEQFRLGYFIPSDYSLRPSDVSKFIRRLRKTVDYKIRYFYCGEYGDENQRPHYHLCIFNHQFNDQQLWKDDQGFYTYTSPNLELLWPFGFSTVQELNFETAAYTARYSLKKVTGKKAADHYLRCDEYGVATWLLPEYIRMSTGRKFPSGIGATFYDKYHDEMFPSDEVSVPGKGVIKKVPRYYESILKSNDPAILAQVKNLRQIFYKSHRGDFTPERLQAKYKCAQKRQRPRAL